MPPRGLNVENGTMPSGDMKAAKCALKVIREDLKKVRGPNDSTFSDKGLQSLLLLNEQQLLFVCVSEEAVFEPMRHVFEKYCEDWKLSKCEDRDKPSYIRFAKLYIGRKRSERPLHRWEHKLRTIIAKYTVNAGSMEKIKNMLRPTETEIPVMIQTEKMKKDPEFQGKEAVRTGREVIAPVAGVAGRSSNVSTSHENQSSSSSARTTSVEADDECYSNGRKRGAIVAGLGTHDSLESKRSKMMLTLGKSIENRMTAPSLQFTLTRIIKRQRSTY